MALTRKLSDLFVTGKDVVLDDGKGPVTLYIRKISPADAEEAYRGANAARARASLVKNDPDSPIFQLLNEHAGSTTKEDMVEQLAEIDLQKKRLVIEAELESEERWSKDDYLQGLHDAWESELKRKHFTDPDEETKRVFDEMQEFNEELEKRLDREREAIKKDLIDLDHIKVKDRYLDAQFERQAEIAWLTEFRRQQLYYAVRDPEDHDLKVFESPKDVGQHESALIQKLREEYENLEVDATEGKD